MKATFKNQTIEIIDEFVEIGFNSEKVNLIDLHNHRVTIGGYDKEREIQVIMSIPHCDSSFLDEALVVDSFLSSATASIKSYLILGAFVDNLPDFKAFKVCFDNDFEFGNMYGTKIISKNLGDNLAKSFFIIGKDGAIYYDFMPVDLEKLVDLQRVRLELNKVFTTYTGVGCH